MRSLSIFGFTLTAEREIAPAAVRTLQDLLTNAVFTGELSIVNQPNEIGGYTWRVAQAHEADTPLEEDMSERAA